MREKFLDIHRIITTKVFTINEMSSARAKRKRRARGKKDLRKWGYAYMGKTLKRMEGVEKDTERNAIEEGVI